MHSNWEEARWSSWGKEDKKPGLVGGNCNAVQLLMVGSSLDGAAVEVKPRSTAVLAAVEGSCSLGMADSPDKHH